MALKKIDKCAACGLPFGDGEFRALLPDGTKLHEATQPDSMRRCRKALLDAQDSVRMAERACIVAWLRGDYKYNRNAQAFANAIEQGEYEHPKGPPPVG